MAASVVLVLIAIFLAYQFYNRRIALATAWRERLSGVHKVLLNKYYVDEIYGAVIVRPLVYFSLFLWKIVDVILIDGLLNGLAAVYGDISQMLRGTQDGKVRSYATVFVVGVVLLVLLFVWEK